MITIGQPTHDSALVHLGPDELHRAHAASELADGRARARSEPARAGLPWAFGEESEVTHQIGVDRWSKVIVV